MSLLLLLKAPAAQATTGTASFAAPTATWAALGSEKLTATITASQLSTWAAQATEKQPATASFAQVATWDAVSVERLTGSATFDQSAGWAAQAASQQAATTGTASFTQDAVVWQAWHKLKIVGYASPQMPPEYAQTTGQPIEVIL